MDKQSAKLQTVLYEKNPIGLIKYEIEVVRVIFTLSTIWLNY